MITITYNRKKLYINTSEIKKSLKKFFVNLLVFSLLVSPIAFLTIDLCNYPEKYLMTWKCQLEKEIAAGDEAAIDYYNQVYLANGIHLFND